ncbi:MAG: hypothetical protein ACRCYX_15715 [Dermatophilaceae bacterium]
MSFVPPWVVHDLAARRGGCPTLWLGVAVFVQQGANRRRPQEEAPVQIALLIIGGVGVLLVAVSLVAGELVDGLFDGFGSDLLSGLAVATFLGAFGFVGALTLDATANRGASIGAGLTAGLLVGVGTGYATRTLMRGGDNATVRSTTLVGLRGSVIDSIPDGGLGQITVTAAGHLTRLNARADEPIPNGTAVRVVAVLSPTSVKVAKH